MSELQLRALSGAVMIAVALAALWIGGAAFWALVSLLVVAMMVEWAQMAEAGEAATRSARAALHEKGFHPVLMRDGELLEELPDGSTRRAVGGHSATGV